MENRLPNSIWLKYTLILTAYLLSAWLVVDKGLDLTDTGYHLTNQMRAAALGITYMGFLPVYWLSDVAAGTLLNHLNLIQLHYAVMALGLVQLIILLVLLRRQNIALTWLTTLVTALLGSFMLVPLGFLLLLPDYYAIPTTALYLTMPALVALLTRHGRWSIAIMVILTLLLLNLRFTTGILIATLPAFIFFLQFIFFKNHPCQPLRPLLIYYAILATASLAEVAYITTFHSSIWGDIGAAEWKNPKIHSFQSILRSYVTETFHQLIQLWPPVLAAGLFTAAKRFSNHRFLVWGKFPYTLLAAWLLTTLYHAITTGLGTATSVQSLVITSYLLGIALLIIQWVFNRTTLHQQSAFVLAGMAMPMAIFAGSNTGIVKLAYCLPLLIAAVLLLVHGLPARSRQHARPALLVFYAISLALVVNTSLQHAYENIQVTPTSTYTYILQNGNLRGIKTTPLSGQAVDATIAQILTRTTSTDTIFTFPAIPMLYYATGRENVIGNLPNFDILQPLHAIATKVGNHLCLSPASTPKLLIFSRHYTFHPLWAVNPQVVGSFPPTNDWGVQEATAAIFHIVETNCHPTILWQNEYFILLEPHPTTYQLPSS